MVKVRLESSIRDRVCLGYTVDPEGNPGAHFLHDTSRTRPPTGPRPRGCAPLTPAGGYAWIHIHTPEPDFFGSTCQMRSTPHGAYMGPQATITTTPPIQSAAATAWGYLRLRHIPLAPIGALLHVAGGTCGAKREPERGGTEAVRYEK